MAAVRHRSSVPVLSILALLGATLALAPPVAAAGCSVRNDRTGTTTDTLQAAVDASAEHDTLLIEGTCVGKTDITGTSLRLEGVPTTEQPTPTLDGGGISRVLALRVARVVVRDLTITNGTGGWGGGVHLLGGRLALRGTSSVTANSATWSGGGIGSKYSVRYRSTIAMNDTSSVSGNAAGLAGGGISTCATVVLNDSSSVFGNTADEAGGIDACGGDSTLTLNDSASVAGNMSNTRGGGIDACGVATLNDSSSVTANTADGRGGGIEVSCGTLTLNDRSSVTGNSGRRGGGIVTYGTVVVNGSSSVTGNTATMVGGGIVRGLYADERVYVCSDRTAISPNDPDDPPEVRHACP
jgi:hypothetical protein